MEKYTLTKKDKGTVHTDSETVKHRYLADGYELRENEPEVAEYSDLTVPQLRAVIDQRNTDRPEDEQISPDGNKPDLVAALQHDDEALNPI